MAKFDEGFYNDGSALAPTLESTAGTPTCAAGAIELDAGDGVRSIADDWDLEESRLPIGIASPADIDAFYLALDIGGTQRPTLQKHWSGWRAGNLNGAISGDNYGNFAGSGAQKPYAQMRHTGDTIYWETSDDGETWDAPFYSTDTYGDVSSCQAYLFKEGSGTVEVLEVGAPPTDAPALTITTQPSATPSGYVMSPSPVVKMTTDGTTVDTSFTGNITAELIGAGGVLLGTLTVAAVLGVATFTNLRPCEEGGLIRFSAAGVDDLDSDNFTVTSGGGSNLILDDSDMIRPMKDGETVAARKRIPLRLRGIDGGPTSESMAGRKAQLSANGGSETASTADIVHVAGTIRGYVQLSDEEAGSFSPGDRVEARVEPDADLLESVGGLDILEGDWSAAPPSKEEIAKASRDEDIKMLQDGIVIPSSSGTMQVKQADGTVISIAITRAPVTGGVVAAT